MWASRRSLRTKFSFRGLGLFASGGPRHSRFDLGGFGIAACCSFAMKQKALSEGHKQLGHGVGAGELRSCFSHSNPFKPIIYTVMSFLKCSMCDGLHRQSRSFARAHGAAMADRPKMASLAALATGLRHFDEALSAHRS